MDPRIQIARAASTYTYERGGRRIEGRRGAFIISGGRPGRPSLWHTVELVAVDGRPYVWVRPGWYQAEMTRMSCGRRALRIRPEGHTIETYPSRATFRALEKGRIYVHGLNTAILRPDHLAELRAALATSDDDGDDIRPDHLAGCFGAGVEPRGDGVRASTLAMFEIYDALGGFEEGRLIPLEIAK